MSNKYDEKSLNTEEMEIGKEKRHAALRRIMAWVMLVFFILLIANILVFHQMIIESSILYMALVAVFFLGNGARGGAREYVGKEQGNTGEEPEPGEQLESGKERDTVEECEPGIVRLEESDEAGSGSEGAHGIKQGP